MENAWPNASDAQAALPPAFMLDQHLVRWARVYFANPPAFREQAVMEFMRESGTITAETPSTGPAAMETAGSVPTNSAAMPVSAKSDGEVPERPEGAPPTSQGVDGSEASISVSQLLQKHARDFFVTGGECPLTPAFVVPEAWQPRGAACDRALQSVSEPTFGVPDASAKGRMISASLRVFREEWERVAGSISARVLPASENIRCASASLLAAAKVSSAGLRIALRGIPEPLALPTKAASIQLHKAQSWLRTAMEKVPEKLARYQAPIRTPNQLKTNLQFLPAASAPIALLLVVFVVVTLHWRSATGPSQTGPISRDSLNAGIQPRSVDGPSGPVAPRQVSHMRVTDPAVSSALAALSPYELAGLRRQAVYGDDDAALLLGMAYETGRGVPQSCVQAEKWVAKSANEGNGAAQYNLGLRYRDGDGIAVDQTEADKWLREAAAHKSLVSR